MTNTQNPTLAPIGAHTPTPWAYREDERQGIEIYYDDSAGNDVLPLIATIEHEGTTDEQARADAALIVAAVNAYAPMRAALKEIRRIPASANSDADLLGEAVDRIFQIADTALAGSAPIPPAPDLLAALQLAEATLTLVAHGEGQVAEQALEDLPEIRAAIAKAKGKA